MTNLFVAVWDTDNLDNAPSLGVWEISSLTERGRVVLRAFVNGDPTSEFGGWTGYTAIVEMLDPGHAVAANWTYDEVTGDDLLGLYVVDVNTVEVVAWDSSLVDSLAYPDVYRLYRWDGRVVLICPRPSDFVLTARTIEHAGATSISIGNIAPITHRFSDSYVFGSSERDGYLMYVDNDANVEPHLVPLSIDNGGNISVSGPETNMASLLGIGPVEISGLLGLVPIGGDIWVTAVVRLLDPQVPTYELRIVLFNAATGTEIDTIAFTNRQLIGTPDFQVVQSSERIVRDPSGNLLVWSLDMGTEDLLLTTIGVSSFSLTDLGTRIWKEGPLQAGWAHRVQRHMSGWIMPHGNTVGLFDNHGNDWPGWTQLDPIPGEVPGNPTLSAVSDNLGVILEMTGRLRSRHHIFEP